MRLFGLLVVAAAVGFVTDVFVQNTDQLDVDVLGKTFTVTAASLVIVGVVVAVVAAVGLLLIGKGYSRARARRAAWRDAARERDELARTLAAERAEREHTSPAASSATFGERSERAPAASADDRAAHPSASE